MPLGDLEDEAMAKVLIVAQDQVLIENLKRELPLGAVVQGRGGRERIRRRNSSRKLPPGLHHRRFLDRADRSPANLPESPPQQRVCGSDSDCLVARRRQFAELRSFERSTRRSRSRSTPLCWRSGCGRLLARRKSWFESVTFSRERILGPCHNTSIADPIKPSRIDPRDG